MPYKKKANPCTVQFNKLIAELTEEQRRSNHRFNLDMIF